MVTGASGAMGQAIVAALSDAMTVVGISRRAPEQVQPDAFVSADIADVDAVDGVASEIEERFGRLDVLVNNAGTSTPRADVDDYDLAEWRRVLDVNLTGTFQMVRAAARLLRAAPAGRVVNISSMLALQPMPRAAAYSASKGALLTLTQELARELAPNCTVNALAPGYMDGGLATPLISDEQYRAFVLDRTPAGRFGQMPEVGALVAYLASERAGFVTGQIIAIDGGFTLV